MAKVNRQEVTDKIVKGLRINASVDKTPDTCSNVIVPVFVCNEESEHDIVMRYNTTATQTNAIVYVTPTDRDFYLTGIYLAITKDAACDNTTAQMTVKTKNAPNAAMQIIEIPTQTTTAGSFVVNRELTKPLLLERNTSILLTAAKTAGTFSVTGIITGYLKQKP